MDDTSRRVGAANEDTEVEARGADDTDEDRATERRTRQIRREIDETREDLSETIDAIQERLRPGNIIANTAERVKDATIGRVKDMAGAAVETMGGVMQTRQSYGAYGSSESAFSGVVDRVRNNPLAAALTGFGLTWLAFSGGRRTSQAYGSSYGSRSRAYDADYDYGYGSGYRYGSSRTTDTSSSIADSAERLTSRAQEYAGDASAAVRRTSRRARTQLQRMIEQNPLVVSAGALVLGA